MSGNSNSLPISLVLSLSHTISGLHWDKIPGDNDQEVGARGILYLLIFQQLGQLVRWSWGYNVLLAPKAEGEDEHTDSQLERGNYDAASRGEDQNLLDDVSVHEEDVGDIGPFNNEGHEPERIQSNADSLPSDPEYGSGEETPITHRRYTSSVSSDETSPIKAKPAPALLAAPTNGNIKPSKGNGHATYLTSNKPSSSSLDEDIPEGLRGLPARIRQTTKHAIQTVSERISSQSRSAFDALPPSLQKLISKTWGALARFLNGVWAFMNPPLWAMLAAILVASIPALQRLFFTPGTFIENSVTSAIRQSGGVAVPLILVVLGANLARNTLPVESRSNEDDKEETKILIAALVSRMLLPTIIMAPILAVTAKYVPVSILDDPIFIIVCFLLTGAPSALQLAQICQINGVYIGAMTRLLFQSYVVWYVTLRLLVTDDWLTMHRILPSTLILVMCALEVVEWAAA